MKIGRLLISQHIARHHDGETPRPLANLTEHIPLLPTDDIELPGDIPTERLAAPPVAPSIFSQAHRNVWVRERVQKSCFAPDEPEMRVRHPVHILQRIEGENDLLASEDEDDGDDGEEESEEEEDDSEETDGDVMVPPTWRGRKAAVIEIPTRKRSLTLPHRAVAAPSAGERDMSLDGVMEEEEAEMDDGDDLAAEDDQEENEDEGGWEDVDDSQVNGYDLYEDEEAFISGGRDVYAEFDDSAYAGFNDALYEPGDYGEEDAALEGAELEDEDDEEEEEDEGDDAGDEEAEENDEGIDQEDAANETAQWGDQTLVLVDYPNSDEDEVEAEDAGEEEDGLEEEGVEDEQDDAMEGDGDAAVAADVAVDGGIVDDEEANGAEIAEDGDEDQDVDMDMDMEQSGADLSPDIESAADEAEDDDQDEDAALEDDEDIDGVEGSQADDEDADDAADDSDSDDLVDPAENQVRFDSDTDTADGVVLVERNEAYDQVGTPFDLASPPMYAGAVDAELDFEDAGEGDIAAEVDMTVTAGPSAIDTTDILAEPDLEMLNQPEIDFIAEAEAEEQATRDLVRAVQDATTAANATVELETEAGQAVVVEESQGGAIEALRSTTISGLATPSEIDIDAAADEAVAAIADTVTPADVASLTVIESAAAKVLEDQVPATPIGAPTPYESYETPAGDGVDTPPVDGQAEADAAVSSVSGQVKRARA